MPPLACRPGADATATSQDRVATPRAAPAPTAAAGAIGADVDPRRGTGTAVGSARTAGLIVSAAEPAALPAPGARSVLAANAVPVTTSSPCARQKTNATAVALGSAAPASA